MSHSDRSIGVFEIKFFFVWNRLVSIKLVLPTLFLYFGTFNDLSLIFHPCFDDFRRITSRFPIDLKSLYRLVEIICMYSCTPNVSKNRSLAIPKNMTPRPISPEKPRTNPPIHAPLTQIFNSQPLVCVHGQSHCK